MVVWEFTKKFSANPGQKWCNFFMLPLLIGFSLLLVYGSLIYGGEILQRDDNQLLDPLFQIYDFRAFFSYLFSDGNPDFQPLRDLSLMFDVLVYRLTGFSIFHAHNVILWGLAMLVLLQILRNEGLSKRVSSFMVMVFTVYPAFTSSIAWISARKHLLAFLLILLAIKSILAAKRKDQYSLWISGAIFYALSLLAQPINLLFAFWAMGMFWSSQYLPKIRGKQLLGTGVYIVVFLSLLVLNYSHYQTTYEANPLRKDILRVDLWPDLASVLLHLGRYCFNLLFPFELATLYSLSVGKSLVGLLGYLLIAILAWKQLGKKVTLTWLSLGLLSLGLVIARIPVTLASDTYILSFATTLWILISLLVAPRIERASKKEMIGLAAFIFVLGAFTARESFVWRSDLTVWQSTYNRQPTCISSLNYGLQLFGVDRVEEARQVTRDHFQMGCKMDYSPYLLSISVFADPNLKIAEKEALLLSLENRPSFPRLLLLAFFAAEKQIDKANEQLEKVGSPEEMEAVAAYPLFLLQRVAGSIRSYCSIKTGPNCERLVASIDKAIREPSFLVAPMIAIKRFHRQE